MNSKDALPRYRHNGKQYRNTQPLKQSGFKETVKIFWDFFFNKPSNTQPAKPFSVSSLNREALIAAPDNSLWRLGHSTVLFKIAGDFYLTDPVFSKRASPFQWAGPKRFHPVPISIAELPPIKAVILSHDHYDHLDKAAVKALAPKTDWFITPNGVGDLLMKWGLPAAKIRQLDWWQETTVAGLTLAATPSQHFSGRGFGDANHRLWCSWVIKSAHFNVFFSGDSGYFDGFKAIGEQYGPFDITLMETGAYNERWPGVHMLPKHSLQAHIDVQGKWMLPIHNGTFDLAMHAWFDPFEQIKALAQQQQVPLCTPAIAERVAIMAPHPGQPWWRQWAEEPLPTATEPAQDS
ncbi:MBL fold metallo-hydrolase [Gallaecimonas mangrovi]|uniref:MBL fold metallo-hydrolase n=1 Tax=Gallaecimonas mangrovi TaxID=2291597 RepID=UPI001D01C658|nr:MBL fold metallo-hydrolase [Gallaecimonas mangrovi]